jgi:hypothetical protein
MSTRMRRPASQPELICEDVTCLAYRFSLGKCEVLR